MTKYEKWEIWYAYVAYEENPKEGKVRPVVITGSGAAFVLGMYVTGSSPRPGYNDIVIRHWQHAGLSKPSTVRLDKKLTLWPSDMRSKIGKLEQMDILQIDLALARMAYKL